MFDVRELSRKFERRMDAEAVQFLVRGVPQRGLCCERGTKRLSVVGVGVLATGCVPVIVAVTTTPLA